MPQSSIRLTWDMNDKYSPGLSVLNCTTAYPPVGIISVSLRGGFT